MARAVATRRQLGWSMRGWKDLDPTGMTPRERKKRAAALCLNMREVNREMRELEQYMETYSNVAAYKRRLLKMLARLANTYPGDD